MTNLPGVNKILENWKVVALSFLGAATFWFFNALNKEYSAMVSYPIEFAITQDSIVIMESLPETVEIDVSAGGWKLFRKTLWFSVDPIRVQLDNPTDIRFLTGSTLLPIIKEHLSELQINFLYTDTLNIHIEKQAVKKVKLSVDSVNIDLEKDYQIVSPITITPPFASIVGPVTITHSLQDEYFLMLSDDEIDKNIDKSITIPLPFEDIMYAVPEEVTVTFKVDRFDQKKMTIPIEKINFHDDSTTMLQDSIVTLSYVIQRRKDKRFSSDDFSILVDYNMLDSQDSTIRPLIIYLPEEVLKPEISPAKIKLIQR